MEKQDLISIIVPVYNVENYIDKCVESIINQSYKNLEIILVDDGSTDSSGEKCDIWAARDRRIMVIHKKNGGLGNARNVGMDHATGEWIGFVDSDDFIEPEMYEVLYRGCVDNGADLCMIGCALYENGRKILPKKLSGSVIRYEGEQWIKEYYGRKDSDNTQISACNKLYKKELLLGKQFPENRYYEDVVMSVSVMLDVNKMVHIDLPYYNYCCDRIESITRQKETDKHVIDLWDMKLEEIRLLSDRGYADLSHARLKKMLLDLANLIGIYTVKHVVSGETVRYLKQREKLL